MVTMQDVADVMGVSKMTVSNAFSRPDQLSVELRQRILERAARMGYTGPSATARALRQGRSNAYGVVFGGALRHAFTDPFTTEWLAGFAEAVEDHGSSILLLSVPIDQAAAQDTLRNHSADGLALMSAVHPIIEAARGRGIPTVLGEELGECWVSIDEPAAATQVARHVLGLGHRDIWVLVGTGRRRPEAPEAMSAKEYRAGSHRMERWPRLAAVLDTLAPAQVTVLQATGWGRDDAAAASAIALDRSPRPTAILALSDNLALGVLDAMAARGLVAGRDLSVTGFDDIPEAARAGLTTVHQPIRDKGQQSAMLLLHPEQQPRRVRLRHELVIRRSTSPVDRSKA